MKVAIHVLLQQLVQSSRVLKPQFGYRNLVGLGLVA
jgi:hypothetical protein